jgi:hypothetical protein
MKSTAKVIAKPSTVKTIDATRELDSLRVTSLYKNISLELDGVIDSGKAKEAIYLSAFLAVAIKSTVTRNLRRSKLNKAEPIVIHKMDYASPKFTAFENDLIKCLLAKYVTLPHTIKATKDCKAIELKVNAATTTRIVAAMQMTSGEVKALPETDEKYRIRVSCRDWIKVARNRIINYCKARLDADNNERLGIKPKAKKGKAKTKVDLANTGKGITLDMVKMYVQNGCAKLNKDDAMSYCDEIETLIDSLREQVKLGKAVQECEA